MERKSKSCHWTKCPLQVQGILFRKFIQLPMKFIALLPGISCFLEAPPRALNFPSSFALLGVLWAIWSDRFKITANSHNDVKYQNHFWSQIMEVIFPFIDNSWKRQSRRIWCFSGSYKDIVATAHAIISYTIPICPSQLNESTGHNSIRCLQCSLSFLPFGELHKSSFTICRNTNVSHFSKFFEMREEFSFLLSFTGMPLTNKVRCAFWVGFLMLEPILFCSLEIEPAGFRPSVTPLFFSK